ncbi:MAG: pyridoxal phosphate-dependent aminotransferase [Desulfomonilia bacterium]|jgi:aspartate/methionine/tyrosine aminotransferase
MQAATKNQSITPFLVMDVLEKANALAAQGREVIHLEVGEPDFDTPACIRSACARALEGGMTHYTHSMGIPELREAICEHYARTYGVSVDPGQVVVTAGSSPALFIAMACLAGTGDEIIMTDPYYACYPNFARVIGASPRLIPTGSADGFQLDPDKVRNARGPASKAVVINSPANPTGICLDDDHLRALADLSLPIISDEIYHGMVYAGSQHTILEYTDRAVVINGFSKAYAMTGWRLGWAVFPKSLVRTAQKLQQNIMICAPAPAQWAGISALTEAGPEVERMRNIFAQRRLVMLEELARHGFNVEVEPHGAFYVLVNMSHVTNDSYRLAMDILENTGVGVTPGEDFGPGGEGYLRFSYANSEHNIREGVSRVAAYLKSL